MFTDQVAEPGKPTTEPIRRSVAPGLGDPRDEPGGVFGEDQRSPDGTRIVAAKNTGGQQDCYRRPVCFSTQASDIVVSAVDGSGERTIASGGLDTEPTWSPASDLIAYTSARATTTGAVLVVAVTTAQGVERTTIAATTTGGQNLRPKWSGDGSKLAYLQTRAGQSGTDVRVHDLGSGTDRLVLHDVDVYPGGPALSPDGSRLAVLIRNRDTSRAELLVAPTSGGPAAVHWRSGPNGQQTSDRCVEYSSAIIAQGPFWSADGARIAWSSTDRHRGEGGAVADFLMQPAGGGDTAVAYQGQRAPCRNTSVMGYVRHHETVLLGWSR